MTVKAIYENGIFRPIEPVHLPENAEVEVTFSSETKSSTDRQAREQVMEILSHSYDTGQTDTAAL